METASAVAQEVTRSEETTLSPPRNQMGSQAWEMSPFMRFPEKSKVHTCDIFCILTVVLEGTVCPAPHLDVPT